MRNQSLMDCVEYHHGSDLELTQNHDRHKVQMEPPYRQLDMPRIILICIVIQSLNARNWGRRLRHVIHDIEWRKLMYLRVIYEHRSETIDRKEQIKHVHCCENHANKHCTKAMNDINSQLPKDETTTNVLSKCADIAEDYARETNSRYNPCQVI